MRKIVTLAALLTVLLVPSAFAAHYANFYVIPVASSTDGVNGTKWMSDLAIQNFQSTPLTVNLIFIQSGIGATDNIIAIEPPAGAQVTIPAGGSVLLQDVVKNAGGRTSAIGSILVGSADERPFTLTSRSYSMSPAGDTVGQTVPPVRDFLDNTLGTTNNATATAYIPGVISNDRFRSNVGFVVGNSSDAAPAQIEVTVKAADGSTLGSATYTVPAASFNHMQVPVRSIAQANFDIGAVEMRIVSGNAAVVPYASVIDNSTADAVFVLGHFPDNSPAAKTGSASIFERLFYNFTR